MQLVEDDYEAARALAEQSGRLLVVDAWAPWCHSCVFFREHVLPRPAFVALEKSVVFASVDTEKRINASFLERFPVTVWPTFLVIHPATQKVLARWAGSLDETQMGALVASAQKGGAGAGPVGAVAADALEGRHQACARGALAALPGLTHAPDRVAALTWGLGCALEWKDAAVLTELVKESRTALDLVDVPADDLSCLHELLVQHAESTGDKAATLTQAERWLGFLEKEAAAAATPARRAAFDSHRVAAALALGQPERAVAALEQSQKDFPEDYNPPARLALLHRERKDFPRALALADASLERCTQGPRCIRLHETRASILERMGNAEGQRTALGRALQYARGLPESQRPVKKIAALEKTLGANAPDPVH